MSAHERTRCECHGLFLYSGRFNGYSVSMHLCNEVFEKDLLNDELFTNLSQD